MADATALTEDMLDLADHIDVFLSRHDSAELGTNVREFATTFSSFLHNFVSILVGTTDG